MWYSNALVAIFVTLYFSNGELRGNVIEKNNAKDLRRNRFFQSKSKYQVPAKLTSITAWSEECKLYESPNVMTYKNCSPMKLNFTYCYGSCQSMYSPSYKGVSKTQVCRLCKPSKIVKLQLYFNCSGTLNTDVVLDRITECKCTPCKT